MKKIILSWVASLCFLVSTAQLPEDVLQYSYFPQHGSARNMAIGGAMGSLGGDISTMFVNPAGLGFFKTREFVFSPGFVLNNNKANYRGLDTLAKRNGLDLGISGLVIGFNTRDSKWSNQAFGIGINQTANFNNTYFYKGTNNVSSQSEVFANQFAESGLSIDDAIYDPRFGYGTGLALYTYLVDTFRTGSTGADSIVIKSHPEFLLEQGIALNQERRIETRGGIYELAFAYAANMDDQLYLGGTIGIPFISYTRRSYYKESDPTGNTNNNFDYYEYKDTISTKGVGINLKLGAIYKPSEFVRLGLALHTPTFYSVTGKQGTSITTNTEAYNRTATYSSRELLGQEGRSQYITSTPWKLMVSGSYVFREINDTRRQRAFITADIEYVGYGGTRFNADGDNIGTEDLQYYRDLKTVIKESYKGAFNYRVGGELKFNTIMFRLGGAYYGNPYREKEFKSNITQATGGLGYRNKGMFIDLTYAHNWIKDVDVPYRVPQPKQNTYAVQNNQRGNVVMTLGFKF
jgi:hypothetical protein